MIERTLQKAIVERIEPQKALLLYGARRVGKTFLLKQITKGFKGKVMELNGEDQDTLSLLATVSISNYRHLFEGVGLLTIDEAQHIPDIGAKLKLIVDEVPGICVIASGSSSFDLKNQAGEPLVGRSTQFMLTPFSQQELSQNESPIDTRRNLETRLIYGSYPEAVLIHSYERKREYLQDMTDAYLLKDILAVDGVKNSAKIYDLLRLIAYQVGGEVSYDELSRSLSMNRNTVERYLDLLQKVFIIHRLGGYSKNLRKEVSKTCKWYFYDNGIRNAIIRDFRPLSVRSDTENGLLWENYIISERMKASLNERKMTQFHFWRTYDNQEIYLIEVNNGTIMAFEMKSGTKKPNAPLAFRQAYPDAQYHIINRENYLEYI